MDVVRIAVRQDPRALAWVDNAMVRHHAFYEWLLEEVQAGLSLAYIPPEWRINIDDPNPEPEAEQAKIEATINPKPGSLLNAIKKTQKTQKAAPKAKEPESPPPPPPALIGSAEAAAGLKDPGSFLDEVNAAAATEPPPPPPEATVGDTGRTESLARLDALALCQAAVNNDPAELRYSGEFQRNPEFCTESLLKNGMVLQYVDPELKLDIELVKIAVDQNGLALQFAPRALREDFEIAEMACDQNPGAIKYAGKELHDDAEFMLRYAGHTQAMQYLSSRLRGDREFMVLMLQQNREGQLHKGHRDTALGRSIKACVSLQPPRGTCYKNGPQFGVAMEQMESTMGVRPFWTPRTTYTTPRQ